MLVGTNTASLAKSIDDKDWKNELEVIPMLKDLGYECLDFSLSYQNDPAFILKGDDWQQRIDEVANMAAKCGMVFSQIHLPYHHQAAPETDPHFKIPGFAEYFDEMMRRAYIAGGMVGAPWAVAHCMSPNSIGFDIKKQAANNRAYYDRYVELGIKHGIGTAFETMIQGVANDRPYRFTANPCELIDYVDSYNDPMVGICWDFGHANETAVKQPEAIRMVGKRLKVTHVNDNYGRRDEHNPPYMGSVDWKNIIPALAEIGYEGELSMEYGVSIKNLPRQMQPNFARFAREMCDHLRQRFYEARAALQ